MADNTELSPGSGGDTIATDDIGGVKYQRVKVNFGTDGNSTDVSTTNPLPVGDAGGTLTVDDGGTTLSVDDGGGSLTVDGSVTVADGGGSLTVDGPLTDAQLRASAVPVADGGGSLTVDGTVTASLSSSTNAGATAKTADYDSGGGTDTVTMVGVAVPASGGAVAGGTSSNPLRTDPTGTTTQPVSDAGGSLTVDGTVTVQDGGGAISVDDNGSTISVDDGAGSLTVDNATISVVGGGVEATAQRVTIASDSTGVLSVDDNGGSLTVDGTVTANLAAGTNNIGDVDVLTEPATAADNAGSLPAVTKVVSGWDGSNVQAVSVDSGGVVQTDVLTLPGSGLSIYRNIDLDEADQQIKGTAGTLYGWYIFNAAASTRYLKFYNATAANVTVGTTTPVLTIPIPAGAAANVEFTNGITFSTAITAAVVTGVADNSTGAPSANDCIVNIFYL